MTLSFLFLEMSAKTNIHTVRFPNSNDIVMNVEFAETTEQRAKGLMYRKMLPKNTGMLFIFDNEKRLIFWMKDTYIPLDIIFISEDGTINSIYPDTIPNNTENKYISLSPSKYALETNAGYTTQNNIKIGDKIKLDRTF